MNTTTVNTWTTIGKDAHQLRVQGGFIHAMKLGANVWSVTKNGRVIGSAKTLNDAKLIAESA